MNDYQEGQHVISLLDQLENEWESVRETVPEAPSLHEIWKAATDQSKKHGLTKHISLYELLDLVYDTSIKCFNAAQRGRTKDFKQYFKVAILNRVRQHLGKTKKGARKRQRLKQYAYDTRDRQVCVVDPLSDWVNDAVADLPPNDQRLIRQIYWCNRGVRELARITGTDRSRLSREHQRILHVLKRRFVEDVWAMAEERALAA